MKLITKQSDHEAEFNRLISISDEIRIAVAFLKISGLKILFPEIINSIKRGAKVTIICGLDFSQTDPEALNSIRKLSLKYPKLKLYLATPQNPKTIFHPKFYLFNHSNNITLVTGSANFTSGGFKTNLECSLLINENTESEIHEQAFKYFNNLIESDFCEPITLFRIKQYETIYNLQKKLRNQIKAKPIQDISDLNFNYNNLVEHYKKFTETNNYKADAEKRVIEYKEARQILDTLAETNGLNKKQFTSLFERLVGGKNQKGLWHSGSIYRKKTTVFNHYKEFQKLVKYIKSHKLDDASNVFSGAKKIVENIVGSGVNTITEIMMTYNNRDFANLNANPITVLREEGNVNLKAHRNSFNGDDYEEYCELIKEINSVIGLRNMLETDSFFNDIYWKIK